MRIALSTNDYVSSEVWQAERRAFNATWVFIGFKRDVPNHNDYIANSIFGNSVFVQNHKGSLKAFANICPHRYSRIKIEKKGNGPILCPYHCWSFDETGAVKGIPREAEFGFTPEEKKKIRLKNYAIETCGEFMFVRESEDGHSLKEFLGGMYDKLAEISEHLGDKIDENELILDCNWKIAVENTLENYHVPKIHLTSFAKLGSSGLEFEFFGDHSTWHTTLDPTFSKRSKVVGKLFGDNLMAIEGYNHYLVYPNMTIGTALGSSFALQEFIPISQDQTKFVSHVFLSKHDDLNEAKTKMLETFASGVVSFNRQVFEEDRLICNQVQLGCHTHWDEIGYAGKMENRVVAYQESYKKTMGD